jgi:UPF0755 protein
MPLQTDPTVIYGLGETPSTATCASGTCRPTRPGTPTPAGLPPTPIAMPGRRRCWPLCAGPTKALYFRGAWRRQQRIQLHLDEHNRAVNQYQRKR